ncbi:hypothetical protein ACFL6Y_03535 [Elusimicrobiota bacterium]
MNKKMVQRKVVLLPFAFIFGLLIGTFALKSILVPYTIIFYDALRTSFYMRADLPHSICSVFKVHDVELGSKAVHRYQYAYMVSYCPSVRTKYDGEDALNREMDAIASFARTHGWGVSHSPMLVIARCRASGKVTEFGDRLIPAANKVVSRIEPEDAKDFKLDFEEEIR